MDINENKIRKIVEETVKKVIREQDSDSVLNTDISKFGIDFLKSIYYDFRKVLLPFSFGDKLSFSYSLKEAYGDILEPDDVVSMIRRRFKLPEECFEKREFFNKIAVYILYANIGINDKLIADSMEKLGYFVGIVGKEQEIEGMKFHIVKFEPMCYLQNDETDNVKTLYNELYHWTPLYNLKNILINGLIPNHQNKAFKYPPRTYLMKGDLNEKQMIALGRMLCDVRVDNKDEDTRYVLLKINLSKIDDNVKFYLDPNAEVGIYTENIIKPQALSVIGEIDFLKDFRK